MSKAIAYSIKDMRRGDVYLTSDGDVIFRDSEVVDHMHYIGPFGDVWDITPDYIDWPAVRIFKQDRQDCEDPREFNRKRKG